MYTIGQVSRMFNLPASTLRFYDREGLFPAMERKNGIRSFGDAELEALRVIECLKASGLEIKDIRRFMEWTTQGASTYEQRKELFENRREAVREEIAQLEKTLEMLEFKCWYYEQAVADGGEEKIEAMLPASLPPEVQEFYDRAHS